MDDLNDIMTMYPENLLNAITAGRHPQRKRLILLLPN